MDTELSQEVILVDVSVEFHAENGDMVSMGTMSGIEAVIFGRLYLKNFTYGAIANAILSGAENGYRTQLSTRTFGNLVPRTEMEDVTIHFRAYLGEVN